MSIKHRIFSIAFIAITVSSCDFTPTKKNGVTYSDVVNATRGKELSSTWKLDSLKLPQGVHYSWLKKGDYQVEMALGNQVPLPDGYERIAAQPGSFSEWLRFLPLYVEGTKVLLFDGREKSYQAGAYRVVNIDVGSSDLQQCADAVMRLKAEYHYSRKEYDKIHFNYTSGHKVAFDDWRKGKKPVVSGSKVSFSAPNGVEDNTYGNFQKYLRNVFMYAGTASLEKELKVQPLEDLNSGDLFIKGGFPGHAVLVVDVAVHRKTGKKIFLLAQSYMPAQSIHLLQNFEHQKNLSPWYPVEFGETLHTPEWDFAAKALKTW